MAQSQSTYRKSSRVTSNPRWFVTAVLLLCGALAQLGNAFTTPSFHRPLRISSCGTSLDATSEFSDFGEDDLQSAGVVIEDLSWRVNKLRLEEENKKRFLKAKPRFLPYDECRKWVQAFNRWHTAKEWRNWIAEGEKRNAYIPSRPDEYYSDTGDWVSWDHFLGTHSNSPSDNSSE